MLRMSVQVAHVTLKNMRCMDALNALAFNNEAVSYAKSYWMVYIPCSEKQ